MLLRECDYGVCRLISFLSSCHFFCSSSFDDDVDTIASHVVASKSPKKVAPVNGTKAVKPNPKALAKNKPAPAAAAGTSKSDKSSSSSQLATANSNETATPRPTQLSTSADIAVSGGAKRRGRYSSSVKCPTTDSTDSCAPSEDATETAGTSEATVVSPDPPHHQTPSSVPTAAAKGGGTSADREVSTPSSNVSANTTTKKGRGKKNSLSTPSPTDAKHKLLKRVSSESITSVEQAPASAAMGTSPTGTEKKLAAKKTKAMLREEKREKQRQRNKEHREAFNPSSTAASASTPSPQSASSTSAEVAAATRATAAPGQDNLDFLLSSVDRDSSVKPTSSSGGGGSKVVKQAPVAVVKPEKAARSVPISTRISPTKPDTGSASLQSTAPPDAGNSTGSAKPRRQSPPRRLSRLHEDVPSRRSSLGPAPLTVKPPTSPHEMASAIASRVGLSDDKASTGDIGRRRFDRAAADSVRATAGKKHVSIP